MAHQSELRAALGELRSAPARELAEELVRRALAHTGSQHLADDLTLVVVRRLDASP